MSERERERGSGEREREAAKVHGTKSEEGRVGEWDGGEHALPEGVMWRRGGFKYLRVYLGVCDVIA